jgi:MoaA/NifB/PqqE/SkfB family radical SAM enzyme
MREHGDANLLPALHPSGVLLVHLLDQCNLRCRHCYMEADLSGMTYLPPHLVKRSLGEVKPLGIGQVYLSGGEPLLYPALPDLLEFASQQEDLEVCVSTNGTLLGPQEARMLKDAGVQVQVSIDGPQAYHDRFRGVRGAFQSATHGIKALVAAKVPVGIVSTICQDNLALLPWLVDWAANMGAERLSVQPLLEVGRGTQIANRKLTEQQMCDLFLHMSDLGYACRSRGFELKLAYRSRRQLLAHPCAAYVCNGARCHRKVEKEIKTVVIRPDGTVLPEIATLHPDYALGNLREGPLRWLVARYFGDGYARFDRLCRTVYDAVMPAWTSPIVPWDEIVSAQSWARVHRPLPAFSSCTPALTGP